MRLCQRHDIFEVVREEFVEEDEQKRIEQEKKDITLAKQLEKEEAPTKKKLI